MLVWLATIIGRKSPTEQAVLRVASFPGFNAPDSPGFFAPAIKQPAKIKRHIVAGGRPGEGGRLFGASEVSYGALVVDNITGEYDAWLSYGYGDPAIIQLVDSAAAYASAVTVLTGVIEQATGDSKELVFRFRDRLAELDLPVQPSTYLGTGGLEGQPASLKGKPKIRLFGACKNIDADPVDPTQNIFSCNHTKAGAAAPLASAPAVRVNGQASVFSADYASEAALRAATVAQGYFATANALGLLRVGGTIGQGQVTADCTERTTSAENHIASLLNRLLLDAGVSGADIIAGDITQLEIDAPYEAGSIFRGETYREALDLLRIGALAWVAPNRLGQYNIRRIKAPGVTEDGGTYLVDDSGALPVDDGGAYVVLDTKAATVATFKPYTYPNVAGANDFEIRSIEPLVSSDDSKGVPAWQITVNYLKLGTVQSSDALAAAVPEADKAFYSQQYRSITREDATIKNHYPNAVSLSFDTLLTQQADATALADDLLALLGVRRELFRVVASYTIPLAQALDLGDVVRLFYPRFGLENGKLFNVHGIEYDAQQGEVELELWG